MTKFLVLYKASTEAFEKMMKSATPEQQKAGMDAWMAWSKKAASSIVDLGGYSVLQAESKEALAAQLREHPHFMMPDSSIEIVELMPLPGM